MRRAAGYVGSLLRQVGCRFRARGIERHERRSVDLDEAYGGEGADLKTEAALHRLERRMHQVAVRVGPERR